MPPAMHYQNAYKDTSFKFIPGKYRNTVKFMLLVFIGFSALTLLLLLGQGM